MNREGSEFSKTRLKSHTRQLQARIFGFKKTDCTTHCIYAVIMKALISDVVIKQVNFALVFDLANWLYLEQNFVSNMQIQFNLIITRLTIVQFSI